MDHSISQVRIEDDKGTPPPKEARLFSQVKIKGEEI